MEHIAGVDEVGRGPLAGPVVAAAVILDPTRPIEGLRDSKVLTEKKREALYLEIIEKSLAWSLGRCEAEEIDQLNIHHAALLAMKRAIEGLHTQPDQTLVDGKFCPDVQGPVEAIIKGDQTVPVISAASIIAKVTRDAEMVEYDQQFPEYGFASHKGYGTRQHLEALKSFGLTPIHRCSFAPCRSLVAELLKTPSDNSK